MKEPSKKTALITGGSRGIGHGIALALAKEGFRVVSADLESPDDPIAGVDHLSCDISSPADRARVVAHCRSQWDHLDVLVNNAGISVTQRGDMLETTEEEIDRLLRINLKGPFLLTQLVAKWMIEGKTETTLTQQAKIINIASLTSYVSAAYMAPYGLSKAALSMMTQLYADRLSEYGINVYEIRPGIIKTSMTVPSQKKYDTFIEEGGLPIKRWGIPEDVAKAVIAVASDLLPYSTGEIINVDGGYHLRRL